MLQEYKSTQSLPAAIFKAKTGKIKKMENDMSTVDALRPKPLTNDIPKFCRKMRGLSCLLSYWTIKFDDSSTKHSANNFNHYSRNIYLYKAK